MEHLLHRLYGVDAPAHLQCVLYSFSMPQASGILALSKSIQPTLSCGCWSVGSNCLTDLSSYYRGWFLFLECLVQGDETEWRNLSKWESGWRWISVFCVSLNARRHCDRNVLE